MLDYDDKTLRAMFGKAMQPTIPFGLRDIALQAQKVAGKLSISGVQPKLSVKLQKGQLVAVERDGTFILKPQTQEFEQLPENEYLCMQMARAYGLNVADSLLLPLADGTPAYLVKRFDRRRRGSRLEKLACEDMHQILGGPSKYEGSHEQIARAVRDHCTFALLECQRLFELAIFNFAIGNGDAHKKNFSILTKDGYVALSPAYDLVSSRLVIPEEAEELALTINGRRNRLSQSDFLAFAAHLEIRRDYALKKITRLCAMRGNLESMVSASQLDQDRRERFTALLSERLQRLVL